MQDRLPPLNALRAFESAARHLSFKKAAAELYVTPAAVSHQIKALEDYLGFPLFRRLTRALELTNEAHLMLPKLREGFASLAAAIARVREASGAGRLTVIAPPSFTTRWLMPKLNRFTTAHPDIELHLASSVQMIDDSEAAAAGEVALADAAEDAPAVTIRFGSGRYPGMEVDRLFRPYYVPVCSPRLREGELPLDTPWDLRFHNLIHDDSIPDRAERPRWETWLQIAKVEGVDFSRGPHFSDASLALQAAIDGLGVALGLRPLVDDEVAEGRLVVPFDLPVPTNYAFYLVAEEAVAQLPAIVAFRKWLLEESAQVPDRKASKARSAAEAA
jgi:LysR family transcriptional regulator, glycine cleavage system transcriptional activator